MVYRWIELSKVAGPWKMMYKGVILRVENVSIEEMGSDAKSNTT